MQQTKRQPLRRNLKTSEQGGGAPRAKPGASLKNLALPAKSAWLTEGKSPVGDDIPQRLVTPSSPAEGPRAFGVAGKKIAAVPAKRIKQYAVAFTRTERRGGRK
ncbi:MAG: hypothetical protein AB1439_06345 [candidate division FCPU426 bacterium]